MIILYQIRELGGDGNYQMIEHAHCPFRLSFFYLTRTVKCLSPANPAALFPLTSPRSIMSANKSDESIKDAEHGVSSSASSSTDVAHIGVKTVEATHKVYGKYSKWFLFVRYAF